MDRRVNAPGGKTPAQSVKKPERAEAEEAVRTLIRWIGEDPTRDGLIETPARVTKAFVKAKLPFCNEYFITSFFRPAIRKPKTRL